MQSNDADRDPMGNEPSIAEPVIADVSPVELTPVQQSIQAYDAALQRLWADESPSFRLILDVMRSRDRLQGNLLELPAIESDDLEKIVQLDLHLQQNFPQLEGDHVSFEQAKTSFQPPESAWWWYLQFKPKAIAKKDISDRFDWLWNLGTVVCLVASTAFVTQTAKAFSTKGFDILGITSTIAQGAGLVFVAGGALTDRGQKTVGHILSDLRIPAKLHAEATFCASLVVLGTAYSIHQNLPMVGRFYLNQGKAYEEKGQFSRALGSYARAQDFMPDDAELLIANGFLYEKLGQFDKAIAQYEKGSQSGDPAFWNAQARAILFREMQKNYWRSSGDSNAVQEAKNLLDRAEKRIRPVDTDPGSQSESTDERLDADIQINQLIANTMAIKPQQDVQTISNLIGSPLLSLSNSQDQPEQFLEKTKSTSQVSTLGNIRMRCFYAAYHNFSALDFFWIRQFKNLDEQEMRSKYSYECAPFVYDPLVSILPDALFLEYFYRLLYSDSNLKINPDYLQKNKLINSLVYNDSYSENLYKILIIDQKPRAQSVQSLETWLAIRDRLTKSIQQKASSPDSFDEQETNLVWRLITNQNGQVMDYLAYDHDSRWVNLDAVVGSEEQRNRVTQAFMQDLKNGRKVEFADLKVVVSPKGQLLSIMPWTMAYPSYYQLACQNDYKLCFNRIPSKQVQAAFAGYQPNLNQPGEIGALRTMIYATLDQLAWNGQVDFYYGRQPLRYQLNVTADGQLLGYQALDSFTLKQMGKAFPRTNFESTQNQRLPKPPTTTFQIEFRGVGPFKLTHKLDKPTHEPN